MRKKRPVMRYVQRGTVRIPSDVNGSYTGMPMTNEPFSRPEAVPVQDADDL